MDANPTGSYVQCLVQANEEKKIERLTLQKAADGRLGLVTWMCKVYRAGADLISTCAMQTLLHPLPLRCGAKPLCDAQHWNLRMA